MALVPTHWSAESPPNQRQTFLTLYISQWRKSNHLNHTGHWVETDCNYRSSGDAEEDEEMWRRAQKWMKCVKLQVILSCPIHSSCPQPMDLLHLSIGLSVHSVFLTEFKKHFPQTVHYCCSSLGPLRWPNTWEEKTSDDANPETTGRTTTFCYKFDCNI